MRKLERKSRRREEKERRVTEKGWGAKIYVGGGGARKPS